MSYGDNGHAVGAYSYWHRQARYLRKRRGTEYGTRRCKPTRAGTNSSSRWKPMRMATTALRWRPLLRDRQLRLERHQPRLPGRLFPINRPEHELGIALR